MYAYVGKQYLSITGMSTAIVDCVPDESMSLLQEICHADDPGIIDKHGLRHPAYLLDGLESREAGISCIHYRRYLLYAQVRFSFIRHPSFAPPIFTFAHCSRPAESDIITGKAVKSRAARTARGEEPLNGERSETPFQFHRGIRGMQSSLQGHQIPEVFHLQGIRPFCH